MLVRTLQVHLRQLLPGARGRHAPREGSGKRQVHLNWLSIAVTGLGPGTRAEATLIGEGARASGLGKHPSGGRCQPRRRRVDPWPPDSKRSTRAALPVQRRCWPRPRDVQDREPNRCCLRRERARIPEYVRGPGPTRIQRLFVFQPNRDPEAVHRPALELRQEASREPRRGHGEGQRGPVQRQAQLTRQAGLLPRPILVGQASLRRRTW